MFTKQGRFASETNFNPPPNIYDPPTSFTQGVKTIKTGSLKGPS